MVKTPKSGSSHSAKGGKNGNTTSRERREHSFQLKIAIIGGVFAIVAGLVGAIATGVFTSSTQQAPTTSSPIAPRVRGDSSVFVRDVTYPDYSHIPTGRRFTKTWELRNAGTVRWAGRYLAALGPSSGKCTYPSRVHIPTALPGATVDISVEVTAARSPGFCYVTWRMVTATGQLYFPGDTKGIWFKVDVVAARTSG